MKGKKVEAQEKEQLVALLGEIDPKEPLGTELFNAIALVSVSVAVEAVCLCLDVHNQVTVYLTQRSATDPAYPGQWHCPGSVLRPGEEIKNVFKRLEEREFKGDLLRTQFVANVNHPTEERGHFFSLVYLCTAQDNITLRGKWVPVKDLNQIGVVEHHRTRIIPAAVGAFVAENTSVRG